MVRKISITCAYVSEWHLLLTAFEYDRIVYCPVIIYLTETGSCTSMQLYTAETNKNKYHNKEIVTLTNYSNLKNSDCCPQSFAVRYVLSFALLSNL